MMLCRLSATTRCASFRRILRGAFLTGKLLTSERAGHILHSLKLLKGIRWKSLPKDITSRLLDAYALRSLSLQTLAARAGIGLTMRDESVITQEQNPGFDWDFFLAHAGADLNVAKNLYQKLIQQTKVFLDAENLLPGDDFDRALPAAQQSSLISVVIVSPNTAKAYYQREEIAAALQMAREDPRTHRVVPVYLNAKQIPTNTIPYGLRLKHSLYVPESGDFTEVEQRLLKTLQVMKKYEEKKVQVVAEQREAITKITGSGSNTDVLAGFSEVTKFVRPLLKALIALFVLMTALLVVCVWMPPDVRGLLATVFGGLCAFLLASIMWLSARSLSYAQQIAQGHINGG